MHSTWRSGAAVALALSPLVLMAQVAMNVPITLIAVDSSPVPVVFASVGQGLMRSTDDGLNFRPLYMRKQGQVQPRVHDLAIDPSNPKNLYAAVDLEEGAVMRSTDGGDTWTAANAGLPTGGARVNEIKALRGAPRTLYARVADTKIYKTANSGDTWTLLGEMPLGITAFAISPTEPNLMIAARESTIYISTDEGATWRSDVANGEQVNALQFRTSGSTTVWSIAFDPTDSRNVLLAATSQTNGPSGLFRSSNQGRGFAEILPSAGLRPLEIHWDPNGSGWVFATAPGGTMYRSGDKGNRWIPMPVTTGATYNTAALDPRDPSRIWSGTSRGIYRTSGATGNLGPQWEQRSGLARPTLSTGATSELTFNLVRGQQGQIELPVRVVETEQWQIAVQISANGGQGWLSTSGFAPTTPSIGRVSVNTANLAPGTYDASIRIASNVAANEQIAVPVKLTVRNPPTDTPMSISTFTGLGTRANVGDNGPASSAAIGSPDSLALDAQGNLYISDISHHVVRKVAAGTGIITRLAGTTQPAFSGDGGTATLASFQTPRGVAADSSGSLYIVDSDNRRLRRVLAAGDVFHVAELPLSSRGVAVDAEGNRYVAVPGQHRVLQVKPDGAIVNFAGTGVSGFRGDDGEARFARLSASQDVAVDAAGNVYIADTENHRIRRVGKDGKIKTVAGSGAGGFQGDGELATAVALFLPTGVAVDSSGNVYIADTGNQRVRMARADGPMVTIAGNGSVGSGGDGGSGRDAQFRSPVDVAVDAEGNVYVADSLNFKVRRIAPPPKPAISRDGIRNFADGSARFAPGSLFRIDGANFLAGAPVSADPPWPNALGETSVSIGGKAAPVTMVSEKQINGQIPYDAAVGEAKVRVTAKDQVGAEMSIAIVPAAPAILVFAGERPMAQNVEGAMITAENPAVAGSEVTVMFTGFGAVDPPVASGAPGDAASVPVLPVAARVGDFDAEVLQVTLAPGMVGVAQARIKLPAELGTGEHPVTITMNGEISNAPKLPVAAKPQE